MRNFTFTIWQCIITKLNINDHNTPCVLWVETKNTSIIWSNEWTLCYDKHPWVYNSTLLSIRVIWISYGRFQDHLSVLVGRSSVMKTTVMFESDHPFRLVKVIEVHPDLFRSVVVQVWRPKQPRTPHGSDNL